jgi:adhesin/invasin
MPGGIGRPESASANVDDVSVSDSSVVSGESVTVSVNADQNNGPISVSLSNVSSGTAYLFKVTDCDGCASENDNGTSFSDIDSANINDGNITLSLQITCTADDTVTVNAGQNGDTATTTLECLANTTPTVTPTVTGTPPTSTPTVTTTPTTNTIALSAVQPNTACGQAIFLFATVKNQSGGFVSGATVTFTSSGGGSFNPASATTVTDGVASSTFTPPTTGNSTITITATTNGQTSTADVPVNCGNAATSTPQPAAPTATPAGSGTVRPPSTGDGGLADESNTGLYVGIATLIGTVFAGALVVANRRA